MLIAVATSFWVYVAPVGCAVIVGAVHPPPASSYVTDMFERYKARVSLAPQSVITIFPLVTFKLLAVYVAELAVKLPLLTDDPPTLISYDELLAF